MRQHHVVFALALALSSLSSCNKEASSTTSPSGDAAAEKAPDTEKAASAAKAVLGAPAPAPVPMVDAVRFAFDQSGSKVGFVGAKITGSHAGGFQTFTGDVLLPTDLAIERGQVTVDIDMATVFTDSERLTGHLKSDEFFDVAQFPKATFVATEIKPAAAGTFDVTGNLSLHGVEKSVRFPAAIAVSGDVVTVRANFTIDRKAFGIVYPGKPDDLIKDDVEISFDLTARKAAATEAAPTEAAPAEAAAH